MAFVSILLASFSAITLVANISAQEELVRGRLRATGEELASLLRDRATDPLVSLDVLQLRRLVADVTQRDAVVYAYVFDAEGRVITDGNARNSVRQMILDDPVSQRAVEATARLVQFDDRTLDVTEPIYLSGDKQGGVRIGFSLDEVDRELSAVRNRNLMFGGAFLLLGIALTAWLARAVVNPLRLLISTSDEVAQGRFDQKLDIKAAGELDVLSTAINDMMARLQSIQTHDNTIIQNIIDSIVVTSSEGQIRMVNPATCELLGYAEAELIGAPIDLIFEANEAPVLVPHLSNDTGTFRIKGERAYRAKNGRAIPVLFSAADIIGDAGRSEGKVFVAQDISERKEAEEALAHQAVHDALTALPNRVLLNDRLGQALAAADRRGTSVALLVIDLDRFKDINDTFGHAAGDKLLQQAALRLSVELREVDTVARLGGDEFAILLPDTDFEGAEACVRRLLSAFDRPFALDEKTFALNASIGVAVCPEHGSDPSTLLRRADIAMYVAKRGQTGFASYAPDQDEHSAERLALVSELRTAIDEGQLVAHYQPVVDLATRRLAHVEALVRWEHPTHGLLGPDRFVPLAEQTGLLGPLDQAVLTMAARQCHEYRSAGINLAVAVNLSARDLQDPELPQTLAGILEAHDLPASAIKIEITESTLMSDPPRAMAVLSRLRLMGVRLGIDDFGTGYSSLAYIKRLPVDELKIDQSFVTDMTEEENDLKIVRATVDLGHALGLKVIAEGVEHRAAWDKLRELGCDMAQGYFVSRPLPAEAFVAWLNDWAPPTQSTRRPAALAVRPG